MRCPDCSNEAPEGSRYCPSCAAPLDASASAPTKTGLQKEDAAQYKGKSSGPAVDQARFIPGTVVDKRYRIVGLLGRGGMGEVYRADDLKLGQPVALKFLPREVEHDAARLERFLNEVRTALKVTHPNVCRVHDVGEVGGQHYISMEYVDGEDLASLLRRIGRLPQDKAVQIARQLCAGLAAAHEEEILHRDLKPANVMIDGRGRAKITDFGLASLVGSIAGADVQAGTPHYMSPEQQEGREVTVRSDVYSLGLVLYELFTGRRAFDATTPAELARLQQESTPSSPSSHVQGLDPAVERAILRCLERHPRQRPASALAVAAALPGGDPLAAALAAGETPSPEMVAAAGETGGLKPWIGALLLAVVLLGLVAHAALYDTYYLAGNVPLDKPPEALAVTAREIISMAGYDEPAADRVHGFNYDHDYLQDLADRDPPVTQRGAAAAGWPGTIFFWYRESPGHLVAEDYFRPTGRPFVTSHDPPWVVPGMTGVWLDPQGSLLRFQAVPPHSDDWDHDPAPLEWTPFFEAAGLDFASFTHAPPARNPLLDCDVRVAWEGPHPGSTQTRVRVETGSYRGRPAYFEVVPPWRADPWMGPEHPSRPADSVFGFALLAGVLIGGPLLAHRNLRTGRGDRRGAFRLAGFFFLLNALWWALRADHVAGAAELWLFLHFLGYGLFVSGLLWIVYVALEPYARRMWPDGLISWSRLIAGRIRDPLIGRDILIGAALGVALRIWWSLHRFLSEWLSLPMETPQHGSLESLAGVRHALSQNLGAVIESLFFPVGWLFILLLLRVILRRQWLAVTVLMLFVTITGVVGQPAPLFLWIFITVAFGTWFFLLVRFGIFCAVIWSMFFFVGSGVVLTPDPSSWFFGRSLLTLLLLAAIATYGFWISRAGRPLMKESLLEG